MTLKKMTLTVILIFCSIGHAITWVSLDGPKELLIRQLMHAGNYLFGSYTDRAASGMYFTRLFRFNLTTNTWEEVKGPDSLNRFSIAGAYGDRLYLSDISTAYSDDFGGSWKYINNINFSSDIVDVNNVLYVATSTGLYRSSDGGNIWSPSSDNRIRLNSLTYLNDRFISLSSKGVLISRDTGVIWDTVKSGISFNASGNMTFGGNNALAAAFGRVYAIINGCIFYSIDSGYTWKNTELVNASGIIDLYRVKTVDSTAYALVDGILFYNPCAWIPIPASGLGRMSVFNYPINIYCFETVGSNLYTATQNSVYALVDGKKPAIECSKGFSMLRPLARCWKVNDLIFVSGDGGCATTNNQGSEWQSDSLWLDSTSTDFSYSKFFQSGSTVFLKTAHGISRYNNGRWIRSPVFKNYIVYDACALDSLLFVVSSTLLPTFYCTIWRSLDHGDSWTILDSNFSFGTRSSPTIMTDEQNHLWLFDNYRTAFHSEDSGTHWNKFNTGLPKLPSASATRTVLGFPTYNGSDYLICTDSIYKFNIFDSSWTTFMRGLNYIAVRDFVVSDSLMVVLMQNSLYGLPLGAESWYPIGIDSTPLLSNSYIQDIFLSNGKLLAATTKSGLLQLDLSPQMVHNKQSLVMSPHNWNINVINHEYLKVALDEVGSIIKIFDMRGRILFYISLDNTREKLINLSTFRPGVYASEISTNSHVVRKYFILNK
jgi:photosystem II stability/assembly factor-like uncharacterized protein